MSQSLAKSFGRIPYSENFNETLKRMEVKARSSPDAIATLEHLLLSLLDDPEASEVMRRCNIGIVEIDLINVICGDRQDNSSIPPAEEIIHSDDVHRVLSQAATAAEQANRTQINGAIVLAALVGDVRKPVPELLQQYGLTFDAVIKCLVNKRDDQQQPEASEQPDPFASLRSEPESSDMSAMLSDDSKPETKPVDVRELFEIDYDLDITRPRGVGGSSGRIGSSGAPDVGAASETSPHSYGPRGGTGAGPKVREQGFGADSNSSLRELYDELLPDAGEEPEIETGKLVENIPRSMRIAIPVMVEARIAQHDSEELCKDLAGDGEIQKHKVYISSAMTVQLRAPSGGFTIEAISPDTQWIENKLGIIDNGNFGAWRWTITPTERGARKLQLVVSARTTDKEGIVAESPLPDQIIEVDVKINYGKLFKKVAGWAVAGIGGGALGKYGENIVNWF